MSLVWKAKVTKHVKTYAGGALQCIGQACFFNVWPPSGANRFAEILSLGANSLSLAEKILQFTEKILQF